MQTIPQTAKTIVQCDGPLPESLRNAINTVLIKPANKLKRWQRALLINPDEEKNRSRYIKSEFKPIVLNTLILCYLVGDAGKVRELFTALIEGEKRQIINAARSIIEHRYEQQFSEFFCLGVVREHLNPIIMTIQNHAWDPMTEELPSPFSTGDLRPIALIYGQNIPWADYHQRYEKALEAYTAEQLNTAKERLMSLQADAVVRLPIVSMLLNQITSRIDAADNYFNYLQKNL